MNYQPLPLAADTLIGTLATDEQSAQRVADRFAETDDVAVSLVDSGQGRWRVTFYFRSNVSERAVRDLAIAAAGAAAGKRLRFARIAAKDWVAESLLGLKPIAAGRFVVHGAHDRGCAAPNRFGIEIEAALAFGTGHHGSTRGCLLALDRLCKSLNSVQRKQIALSPCNGQGPGHLVRRAKTTPARLASARSLFPRILDLGTGSGVLAIAAARSLHRRVLASEIDPHAARIARDNARLNRCAALVRVCCANGLAAADIRAGAPFDLVFANILLAPLQRLAAPLTGLVARHGRIILSGLLNAQASAARAAYPHFTLERRIAVDGWTTLVLKRSDERGGSHYLPLKGGGRRPKVAGRGSTPRGLPLNLTPPRRAPRVDPPLSGWRKVHCQ
jgi:ribosomal protein L11 methyltransferase